MDLYSFQLLVEQFVAELLVLQQFGGYRVVVHKISWISSTEVTYILIWYSSKHRNFTFLLSCLKLGMNLIKVWLKPTLHRKEGHNLPRSVR
jgi:hypothetical protein